MYCKQQYTHKGTIQNKDFGWVWEEKLKDEGNYWVSQDMHSASGKKAKYRKRDGKRVGGDDYLDLESIKEL
ncbi:hypothetical protein [Escherichia coli]|uniref:hypothetical protein n=1 Tax=Escherichia coli TaxID=562 RepID=UPI000CFC80EE|nr:hypothetical protein [Escherichia coli]UDW09754.1 hypothetical protein [Escherichia phage 18-1-2]UJQ87290.1 hypothetical protein [Escherichia phage 24-2-1]UJQ87515.1 hypothetical protein [Escherichia phage 19-1-2]UOX40017.1 hypothetical protein [Escherichia phage vB_EcoM_TH18]